MVSAHRNSAEFEQRVSSPASPQDKYGDHHVLVEYPINSEGKNTVTVTGQDFVTLQVKGRTPARK